jgi:hypothetical protein
MEDMESMQTTLAPQEKIAWVREGYAAPNAGDIEKSLEVFSDDLVFHSPVFLQPLRGMDVLRATTKRILQCHTDPAPWTAPQALIQSTRLFSV